MGDDHGHDAQVAAFGSCPRCELDAARAAVPTPWPEPYARRADQIGRVADAMADGRWHTLAELAAATGDPEPSISARLRDLRHVGHNVERQRIPGAGGLHRYRIHPPVDQRP